MADEAQDKYTTLNGMRFHYREWGDAKNPPLLLLHGVTGHARQWDRFAREMVDSFHIYALDQRGHGETDWGKSYRPQDFDEDVRAFVSELAEGPVAIVGQSLGGRIGAAFAANHPELITRLVIGDIGPDVVSAPGGARTAAAIAAAQNVGFEDVEEPIAASQRANPRVASEDIRYSVISNLKQGPDGRWVWLYDAMGLPSRFDDLPSEDKGWEQLRLIRCPVLLVRGEESDVLSEATASRMMQTIADCRLAVMPQSGHGVPRDNPAAFLAAVRPFLKEGL